MEELDENILKNLYRPPKDSHKGQNGKLLLIGGSKLFHAASLWALKVASRIVDLVHYASIPENNALVQKAKEEFRDGIVIPRSKIEDYIEEDDCILIGCGMERDGETRDLTEKLLKKYPHKKWVVDAGALQMMEPEWIPKEAILTPHKQEFEQIFNIKYQISLAAGRQANIKNTNKKSNILKNLTQELSQKYNCTILLKGVIDIIASSGIVKEIEGGNAGMTKGGTGDVLAGLTAALYCKNEAFLSAVTASYINKKAAERLFEKVGYYFNASDLSDEIPKVMKELIIG